jgi:hypothetical protein
MLSLFLLSILAQGSPVHSCNQKVYDIIYKRIIQDSMTKPDDKESMDLRNNAIEALRLLCNGQKSKYETNK